MSQSSSSIGRQSCPTKEPGSTWSLDEPLPAPLRHQLVPPNVLRIDLPRLRDELLCDRAGLLACVDLLQELPRQPARGRPEVHRGRPGGEQVREDLEDVLLQAVGRLEPWGCWQRFEGGAEMVRYCERG